MGESAHKTSLFYYPLILLDHVGSVIQRVRFREVPLFEDSGQFIESINWTFHEYLRNTRQEKVKAVIEQTERPEQVMDGTVFPKKRVTGSIECQRDNKISQSDIHPVVEVRSFLEVLVGQSSVLVNDWLHVFWGEKLVVYWEKGFLHQWSVCEPVNQGVCASVAGNLKNWRIDELVAHHEDLRTYILAYLREVEFLRLKE